MKHKRQASHLLTPVTNAPSDLTARDQRGASLVEYSLLVALIASVSIIGVRTLGEHARDHFQTINSNLGPSETAE
jgi:Flp pilus assembly pilin Flp